MTTHDPEYLKEHLRRQLRFLKNSALLFDHGEQEEAIRAATSLRVLFHDTNNSESLLTLLGAKDTVRILSTVPVDGPGRPQALPGYEMVGTFMWDGLTRLSLPGGPVPKLDDVPHRALLSADKWWTQWVYTTGGHDLTRRDLVLGAANKDGGAHVDRLKAGYKAITEMWYGLGPDGRSFPLPIHLVGLRQLAHEVLRSDDVWALAGIQVPAQTPSDSPGQAAG
jgi:hypothetical protein